LEIFEITKRFRNSRQSNPLAKVTNWAFDRHMTEERLGKPFGEIKAPVDLLQGGRWGSILSKLFILIRERPVVR
jgi:hypothetical protein